MFEPQPMGEGRYYRLPNGSLSSSGAQGVGMFRATPKFIPNAITLNRIGAGVTVMGDAGSTVRLGIYADNGTLKPSALILDAGTITSDTTGDKEITISQRLGRGWYWFGAAIQNVTVTQPTLRTIAVPFETIPIDYFAIPVANAVRFCCGMTGTMGALPATFTENAYVATATAIFGRTA